MKLIIDIPEWKYKSICEGIEASKRCGVVGIDPDIHEAIYKGIPYEERPQDDLISREALKKAACVKFYTTPYYKHILDLIDNAPTVFSCNACKNMGNERECIDCHDYSNYVHYEERPQDEWKLHGMIYYCSNCGHDCGESGDNFCGNCGADMWKGGAE